VQGSGFSGFRVEGSGFKGSRDEGCALSPALKMVSERGCVLVLEGPPHSAELTGLRVRLHEIFKPQINRTGPRVRVRAEGGPREFKIPWRKVSPLKSSP